MSESEIQLQLTMASIFEKLKIFKKILLPEQLVEYNKLINEAREKHSGRYPELSKEALELLEKHFS